MAANYNETNPAVRRSLREMKDMAAHPSDQFVAAPLEDDLFDWHFTIRGPPDSAFDGGVYHGRIVLPSEYPFKPPDVYFLNANGRFQLDRKICLSVSAFHPETWQPSWTIRTVLLAIISFMPTAGNGAIGALDYSDEERRRLAADSIKYTCRKCHANMAQCLGVMNEVREKGAAPKETLESSMGSVVPAKPTATPPKSAPAVTESTGLRQRGTNNTTTTAPATTNTNTTTATVAAAADVAPTPTTTTTANNTTTASHAGPATNVTHVAAPAAAAAAPQRVRERVVVNVGTGSTEWIDNTIVVLLLLVAALLMRRYLNPTETLT